MKLADVRGELSLRRVPHFDCFDRIALDDKLRGAREAMAAAGTMDKMSRRNAASANSVSAIVEGGAGAYGGGADTRPRPPSASAAEQAVSSPGASAALASPRTPSAAEAGNPFGRAARSTPRRGGNSSSSFRDSSRGIGFGDANSHAGNVGGGDGVRLGRQRRTSYGGFDGGSAIGGDFGGGTGGGSSAPSSGGGGGAGRPASRGGAPSRGGGPSGGGSRGSSIGGASASFRDGGSSGGDGAASFQGGGRSGVSGGGGTSTFGGGGTGGGSFVAGGVSIKGDSSIFSSAGYVGQGGGADAFGGGGAVQPGGAGARSPPRQPDARREPRGPAPPAPEEPALDWLVQDPLGDGPFEDPGPVAEFSRGGGRDDYPASDDAPRRVDAGAATDPSPGRNLSEQYRDRGLDVLSGGQAGFGAVQGDYKGGGGPAGDGSGGGGGGGVVGGDFGGGGGERPGGRAGGGGGEVVAGGVVGSQFAPRRGGARTSDRGANDYFEDMDDECV